jgi:hypothetical protein
MLMQFLDMAAVVCKSNHQDFKKAKERTWGSASLRAKTKRDSAKGKLKKTWDGVSLRKETLKNRKEARF